MLQQLPASWQIVNAAVSNRNDWEGWEHHGHFRQNEAHLPDDFDFGAVAVLYNLRHANICNKVAGKTPGEIILASHDPCQPADMLLYQEFAEATNAYSAKLPLVFYSKQVAVADPGAINNHSQVAAQAQRNAWNAWQNRFGKKHRIYDEW
jgi:hypothetical protein